MATNRNQKNIEAIAISSYSKTLNQVNSRLVNIKYIEGKEFIFFSNYNSTKAREFNEHKQVSALFYWNNVDLQIRMKGIISRKPASYNQEHFEKRDKEKNILAVSSQQSNIIDSYDSVKAKYKLALKNAPHNQCPNYWGGYSFIPNYFEFWQGNPSRINIREVFEIKNNTYNNYYLEP